MYQVVPSLCTSMMWQKFCHYPALLTLLYICTYCTLCTSMAMLQKLCHYPALLTLLYTCTYLTSMEMLQKLCHYPALLTLWLYVVFLFVSVLCYIHAQLFTVWTSKAYVIILLLLHAYSCCGTSAPLFACVCTVSCLWISILVRLAMASPRCRHCLCAALALLPQLRAVCVRHQNYDVNSSCYLVNPPGHFPIVP